MVKKDERFSKMQIAQLVTQFIESVMGRDGWDETWGTLDISMEVKRGEINKVNFSQSYSVLPRSLTE